MNSVKFHVYSEVHKKKKGKTRVYEIVFQKKNKNFECVKIP